tara:strand:+ start:1514 stop:1726 length:213 start_codon:yes stop_codon:yes gene_type:complete
MHQRPGKSYRAAAFDGPDKIDTRSLVNLFKDAKEQTDGDVSFYMEQLEEYFRDSYNPKKGLDKASRVLGL